VIGRAYRGEVAGSGPAHHRGVSPDTTVWAPAWSDPVLDNEVGRQLAGDKW